MGKRLSIFDFDNETPEPIKNERESAFRTPQGFVRIHNYEVKEDRKSIVLETDSDVRPWVKEFDFGGVHFERCASEGKTPSIFFRAEEVSQAILDDTNKWYREAVGVEVNKFKQAKFKATRGEDIHNLEAFVEAVSQTVNTVFVSVCTTGLDENAEIMQIGFVERGREGDLRSFEYFFDVSPEKVTDAICEINGITKEFYQKSKKSTKEDMLADLSRNKVVTPDTVFVGFNASYIDKQLAKVGLESVDFDLLRCVNTLNMQNMEKTGKALFTSRATLKNLKEQFLVEDCNMLGTSALGKSFTMCFLAEKLFDMPTKTIAVEVGSTVDDSPEEEPEIEEINDLEGIPTTSPLPFSDKAVESASLFSDKDNTSIPIVTAENVKVVGEAGVPHVRESEPFKQEVERLTQERNELLENQLLMKEQMTLMMEQIKKLTRAVNKLAKTKGEKELIKVKEKTKRSR